MTPPLPRIKKAAAWVALWGVGAVVLIGLALDAVRGRGPA